ncbi:MAG: hypothetical protein JOZ73_11230 [Solirubrobacterales bacterium]|nr:hypothetical protein [Solirubrobacterales bacterium]
MTTRSRALIALHRFVLRTADGPLRRLWVAIYRASALLLSRYVAGRRREPAVYLRGSAFERDFVPGLSDVDTAIVLPDAEGCPGAAGERARRRWDRLARALPVLRLILDGPMVFEQRELEALVDTTAFTYGLDREPPPIGTRAAYFGAHSNADWMRSLERPGLAGLDEWRLVRGPERRPLAAAADPNALLAQAWLELVYLWRWTFPLCLEPGRPGAAAFCVKLISEPTRIWLLLAHGENPPGQQGVLARALRLVPEEEEALRLALELRQSLDTSPPAPLADALRILVRMSGRIERRIADTLRGHGTTEVRLGGFSGGELLMPDQSHTSGPRALPLVDWRALSCPLLPDESFALADGDVADPRSLAEAAMVSEAGTYSALLDGDLLLLPAAPWWRSRLRALKARFSDPVSFAVLEGKGVAVYPNVRGWSIRDSARRAVAEHAAWLRGEPGRWAIDTGTHRQAGELGLLLTAARAGLVHESSIESEPLVPLTVTGAMEELTSRRSLAAGLAQDVLASYRDYVGEYTQPSPRVVAALRRAVERLPAYAS